MTARGHTQRFAEADHVLQIMVFGDTVEIKPIKSRDGELSLAAGDPRLTSLQAAVLRFIDGDAA